MNSEINSREFGMSDLKVILFGGKRWMLTAGLLASVAMFMNWGFLVSIGAASLIWLWLLVSLCVDWAFA